MDKRDWEKESIKIPVEMKIGGFDVNPKEFFDGKIGKLFVDYLKKNGYDGAYFIEEGSPIYVVFNSNQIKSVENDGTWDIADDNIFS